MTKAELIQSMNHEKAVLFEKSDLIWDHPETRYEEEYASGLLKKWLRTEGFEVTDNLGGIPTAFEGRYGNGGPVIGFLGEFDALAGMSQQADAFEKAADKTLIHGHGCGHNMLGCGSLYAAVFLKRYLEETGKTGTVVFFGCPAEEGGAGKAFLAKAGVFHKLDAALSWHPSDYNAVSTGSSLANIQLSYEFHGISAHAAAAPHMGRSALDAVELMNVGCNYLREHIIPEARIHYAVIDSGGTMPGIVQAYAKVLYMIRAPRMEDVRELEARLNKIGEGAALMTGTSVTSSFVKASYNLISNTVLERILYENMKEMPAPKASAEQLDYAGMIQKSMEYMENSLKPFEELLQKDQRDELKAQYAKPVYDFLVPYVPVNKVKTYSTDVGDVSWITPTAQIAATTWAANSFEHTWQVVAQGKSSLAHEGTLYAAKILCAAGIDIINKPEIVQEAGLELKDRLNGNTYQTLISDDMTYKTILKNQ